MSGTRRLEQMMSFGPKVTAPKPPRKCVDCGGSHYNQRSKRCKECAEFVRAFTENKHGELA